MKGDTGSLEDSSYELQQQKSPSKRGSQNVLARNESVEAIAWLFWNLLVYYVACAGPIGHTE